MFDKSAGRVCRPFPAEKRLRGLPLLAIRSSRVKASTGPLPTKNRAGYLQRSGKPNHPTGKPRALGGSPRGRVARLTLLAVPALLTRVEIEGQSKHRSRNNCPVSIADHPSNGGRNNFPDFGHHAACQRGAMFSASGRPAPRFFRPPRCSPAWSHVQHQPSSRSTLSSATTLLASVEPCSAPGVVPFRAFFAATTLLGSVEPCSAPAVGPFLAFFGHHAACQRGAMFSASRRPVPRFLRPPRCLPAWSHVQHQPSARSTLSSATTLLASVEPCSAPAVVPLDAFFGHHAACQRGAMFSTSGRPVPRFLRPPRCLAAWSHVQHQRSSRSTLSSATTLLASVEPCSAPAVGIGPARAIVQPLRPAS